MNVFALPFRGFFVLGLFILMPHCSGGNFTTNKNGEYARTSLPGIVGGVKADDAGGSTLQPDEDQLTLASAHPHDPSGDVSSQGLPQDPAIDMTLRHDGNPGPTQQAGSASGASPADLDVNLGNLFVGSFVDSDRDGDGVADSPITIASSLSSMSLRFSLSTPHQIAPKKLKVKTGIDFFILMDVSGSMSSSINGAKNNIHSFLDTLKTKYDPRVTLIKFRNRGQLADDDNYVFGPTSDTADLISKLGEYNANFGDKEPGLHAIKIALDRIEKERGKTGGLDRFYVIIIITDEESWDLRGTGRPSYGEPPSTKFLQKRFNELKFQERVKFFASLGNYQGAGPNLKKQFRRLLNKSLTNVPAVEDRGDVDLAFPFGERALIEQIKPQIEILIPAVDLSCVLSEVTVTPRGGELKDQVFKFAVTDLAIEKSQEEGSMVAYVDDLLRGSDIQSLKGHSADIVVQRCCTEKTDPPRIYDESNLPQESQCVSSHSKQITFNFAP